MAVNQRGKKWEARLRWRLPDGSETGVSQTFTRKKDAQDWELEQKINHKQGMVKPITTFIYIFDKYYDTYKKPHLRQNTLKSWNFARQHAVSYFGDRKPIQKINGDDYQKFINSLSDLSHSSVKLINQCCTQVLEYAVQQGYINRNPSKLAHAGGQKAREVEYLNLNQIKAVLKYCRNYHSRKREHKPVVVGTACLIEAAILSGARLGELAGLTWDSVDDKNNILHITRQLDTRSRKDPTPKFRSTKTDNSVRDIPVPSYLIDDMKKLRCDGDVLVFYTQRNKPVSTSSASRYTHRMLKKLNINNKNFHFHSFRHSHVALLLSRGVDIYAISRRLGHNNIRTTLQIYSYLLREKEDEENKKIIKVLNNL